MALGFSNAALPSLIPLQRSHSENQIEAELKQLFLDLFRSKLAAKVFDANVLGMPHLGSLDLVRRSVNAEGLALLQGAREDAATRYVYRAWKSRNAQGRGLHFLKTYLQLLFPDSFEVSQLWHDKNFEYPKGIVAVDRPRSWWLHQLGTAGLKVDGKWGVGRRISDATPPSEATPANVDGLFLTSRIDIALGFGVDAPSRGALLNVIRSIIPARFVPLFRFLMHVDALISSAFVSALLMRKAANGRFNWPGCVVAGGGSAVWRLGVDGALVRLPKSGGLLKLGRFKLGERRGGASSWGVKSGRIHSSTVMSSLAGVTAAGLPRVGEVLTRLDGSWGLGRRSIHVGRSTSISSKCDMPNEPSAQVVFFDNARIDLQGTPSRLGRQPQLGSWRRLDGRWSVGEFSRPFGFSLRRDRPIDGESRGLVEKQFDCDKFMSAERLARPAAIKLARTPRRLDGSWFAGSENKLGRFRLDGRRLRANKLTTCPRLGGFAVSRETPGVSTYDAGPARRLRLDGGWMVGRIAGPEVTIKVSRPS